MEKIHEKGHLINNAGRKRYSGKQSVKNVITYIWREGKHKDRVEELEAKGALGALEYAGTECVLQSFAAVQGFYNREGTFGRYLDHEIYEFGERELDKLREKGVEIEEVARKMAEDIYEEGYQVAYAVHKKADKQNIHVHFAVNTVNYKTWRKRHENRAETSKREKRFQGIVEDALAWPKGCERKKQMEKMSDNVRF